MNAHTIWIFLSSAWGEIGGWKTAGPLVGIFIGYWLTRSWQRKQWVLESKKSEYRELITTLSQSFHCMEKYWTPPDQISAVDYNEQRELREAGVAARRIIEDRIFIYKLMRTEKIEERWGLVAAENDLTWLRDYWNDLHDALVKAAHRDLGIK